MSVLTTYRDRDLTSRIYFIEAVGTGLIKIGYALNVDTRLRTLATSSAVPLQLLGTIEGGPTKEAELPGVSRYEWSPEDPFRS